MTRQSENPLKPILQYLPLLIVFLGGLATWFQVENSVLNNQKEIQRLEQEILEKEKLSDEKINNLKEALKQAIEYLNDEDDGVRSDFEKEDAHLWTAIDKLEK